MRKTLVLMAAAMLCGSALIAQRPMKVEPSVMKNIMTRSSVRAFAEKKVKPEQFIEPIMQAAMAAPSAMNRQPWEFIVITDEAMLKHLGEEFKNAGFAANSIMTVIVCGNMKETIEGEAREFWVQDCSAATENLLLAAHSMGLGATWCGVYPSKERVVHLSKFLNLPEHIIPLNIIPIGMPQEPGKPKDKWKSEKIHINKYGNNEFKSMKEQRPKIELKEGAIKATPKKKETKK